MTKYFNFFLLTLAVAVISCNEDEPTKANALVIDGTSVKIENVFVNKYTNTSGGSTFYFIYFASEGIEKETFTNYDDLIGSGEVFSFELESTDANSLPANDYTTYEDASLYEMVEGDWDFITDDISLDGAIKVAKSGSTYTFEFSFTGEKDCSVYYKGPITEVRFGR